MKKATKAAGLSIIPVFEEVLSKSRTQALPVIPWSDEVKRGRGRSTRAIEEPDFATAFQVACEHIRMLESQLAVLANVARSNLR